MAKAEEATRVSLVPDTKAILKGASLKKTEAKSKTTTTKKTPNKTNFDRDTSDEEEEMDITGSLSGNETEAGEEEPTIEPGDDERAEGLLIGGRTGCPLQQAATARISSEATHILDNTLTKTNDELILEGTETEGAKTAALLP